MCDNRQVHIVGLENDDYKYHLEMLSTVQDRNFSDQLVDINVCIQNALLLVMRRGNVQ